jgi:hypothetical protein
MNLEEGDTASVEEAGDSPVRRGGVVRVNLGVLAYMLSSESVSTAGAGVGTMMKELRVGEAPDGGGGSRSMRASVSSNFG